MKLIHVFNFALVSKRFHFISRAYKYFLDKLRISKHIISFDFHYLLFLLKELLQLNKEIFGTFKDSIKTNAFVFNLVIVKLMGLVYKLLLFRIYCHLFFCVCGSKTASWCQLLPDFLLTTSTEEVNSTKTSLNIMLILNSVK